MKIEQIHLQELGDTVFEISFMYSGHDLKTQPLSRSASTDEVINEVKRTVNAWETSRATTNFDALKAQYEGKTVNI